MTAEAKIINVFIDKTLYTFKFTEKDFMFELLNVRGGSKTFPKYNYDKVITDSGDELYCFDNASFLFQHNNLFRINFSRSKIKFSDCKDNTVFREYKLFKLLNS